MFSEVKCFIMTWHKKAEAIAAKLLSEMKDTNKESIFSALRQSALKGMEYECGNWCNKVR